MKRLGRSVAFLISVQAQIETARDFGAARGNFEFGNQDCPVISQIVATGYDTWFRQTQVFRA